MARSSTLTTTEEPIPLTPLPSIHGSLPDDNLSPSEAERINVQQLLPTDSGPAAWRLLIAAFMFEAVMWGFQTSFGVFQNYYTGLEQFKGKASTVALVGTLAQAIGFLGAPISGAATKRFPKYQRIQIYFGYVLTIAGLVAGSFADTLGGLIATQGVMYGAGFIMLTYPIISMVDEFWVARKGMAFGLIAASSGFSGAIFPFIIEAMLNRYGYKTTLRCTAVAMTVITLPLIPFLHGRLPAASHSTSSRTNWSFLRKKLFWIYWASTFLYGLGFFFAPLYLPSYAAELGLGATKGALLLAIMAIAQVMGQFAFGYFSDIGNSSVSLLAIVCSLISTVTALTLWGLAKSLAPLIVFSILYGFFAYGYTSMRVAMGRAVSDDDSAAVATYSILVFSQGIGNVLAGPLSGALMAGRESSKGYGAGLYGVLIGFTGVCFFGSAAVIGLWHLWHSWPKNLR